MSTFHKPVYYMLARTPVIDGRRSVEDYELAGSDFDYLELVSGSRFQASWPGSLRLILESGDEPIHEYLYNPLGFCIMSPRLYACVADFLDNCEVFPAPVFEPTGDLIAGYKVINILNVLDCIDIVHSVVSRHRGEVFVNEPAFIANRIPRNCNIFRVRLPNGSVESSIYVSGDFVEKLRGNGFGIGFVGVDVY